MRPRILVALCLPFALHAQQSAYPSRAIEMVIDIGKGRSDVYAGMTDIAVSAAGNIYVLEGRACTVKVFDQTGKQIKAFGGAGSGKGQCNIPASIDIVDSLVIVTDYPRNGEPTRRVMFDLNGKARDVEAITAEEMRNRPKFTRGGTKVFSRVADGGVTVYVVKADGTADSLFRFVYDLANIRRGDSVSRGASGFGLSGAWGIQGDSMVVFADGYSGVVKWFLIGPNGATVVRTAEMGLKPDPVTPEDLIARAERISRLVIPGRPVAPGPVTITDAPTHWSLASTMTIARDGSVWVTNPRRSMYTTRMNGEYVSARIPYTVFPPTGQPYSVNVPVAFTPYEIIGDMVYGYSSNAVMGSITVFRLK